MTVNTPKQYIDRMVTAFTHPVAVGESSIPRASIASSAAATSGVAYFTYFTAQTSASYSTVTTWTGTSAAGGATLCRTAIYSVAANGDVATLQSTPNDTALWAAANTAYPKTMYAPLSIVRGTRYAVLLLFIGTTPPSWVGGTSAGSGTTAIAAILARAPRMCGQLTGQSDVPYPGPFTDASLGANSKQIYVELS